jgi:hypothetical protein
MIFNLTLSTLFFSAISPAPSEIIQEFVLKRIWRINPAEKDKNSGFRD